MINNEETTTMSKNIELYIPLTALVALLTGIILVLVALIMTAPDHEITGNVYTVPKAQTKTVNELQPAITREQLNTIKTISQ